MTRLLVWAPAVILGAGAVLVVGIDTQREMPLRVPLAEALPRTLLGREGRDVPIDRREIAVAGVSDYLLRSFRSSTSDSPDAFSVYVGYYTRQTQGRTIHSPRNCLPGAGWSALASEQVPVAAPEGPVTVNRYLLQNGAARAVVLYWYQGRGRIASNEYLVKWELLRDAALRRRSDEALVRVVLPLVGDAETAWRLADSVAAAIIPSVGRALPE